MKPAILMGCISALALMSGVALAAAPSGLDANGHLMGVVAPSEAGFTFTRLTNGVQVRYAGVTKNIIFYGPEAVRVNANLGQNFWTAPSLVVIDKPDPIAFDIRETATALTIVSKKLTIVVDKRSGALTFTDEAGKVYTSERARQPETLKPVEISGAPTYEVSNSFNLKPDEGIFGFGFVGEGELNRRGKELLLVQTNTGIIIPVMMSSERYGILWDTYSVMKFRDDADGATLWAESAPGGVDYYFMGGDNMDAVVAAYRDLTGQAPMYPKQAFGLFMSKERYQTQNRLLEVAQTFRKEQFPLDYIVQDWQYWGSDKDGTWSGMIWDKDRFPDPEGVIRDIHDLNMKLMISIWPSVGNDTQLAKELDANGLRFEPLHWISKKARIYDAFSPKGREIYFKHIKTGLLDKGVDALWMDGTEVEVGTAVHNPDEVVRDIKGLGTNALGDFTRYLNPYTLLTTQGTYDGQRATSNKRVFTLTRSAWAGAQRTGAASWSGDNSASWKTLAEQIDGGVNVTITGNPYWTQDTGGFFVNDFQGGEQNPAYRELFARWFQYAAFNPIMRVHGTSIEREPYIFKDLDPQMYQSLIGSVNLRYRLLPYIYSLNWKVTDEGYTLMRAVPMDFPDDRATHAISDTFMFGPSLLVHPVTRPMYHFGDPPAETIPAAYLRTNGGQPGLEGQYFAGEAFDTPKGKVIDTQIDMNWPGPPLAEPPAGLTSLDHFSARWEGVIIAPEDGEYEIGLEGDDGFRLFLDGQTVVEDWKNGPKRYKSVKRVLKKGQSLPVRIDYYQGEYDRGLRLAWRTPTQLRGLETAEKTLNLKMETYLPKGSDWYDFYTHQPFTGGQTVAREAPLDIIPLYVRAGSILPMGPVQQYATQKPEAPYEVRVYPGADAAFTIYEDDNETYDYEKGEYATYQLVWNDADRTLTIGARKGTYPGLVPTRILNIVIADPTNASGGAPAQVSRTVSYSGKPVTVRFK
ncbi:PA14 domain-containing protein [Asticcacaulis sp. SL142]|uniref:glycoside hydrolase family 31 protein n=1 Tax=Asticcacaulis sp. SL142 TaxID=2995155 RepID=UPI00226C8075|nr:TIM-barrel domain-containing protein [Asticcacaulis sp. SL142]WAC46843.1 PA14 domain-containing protein [Asticcacaulis sp. SL142]